MTDTPLTDAHVRQLADGLKHPHWVAFARGLERENAALREKVDDWENAVAHALDHRPDEQHCTCVPPLLGKVKQLERDNAALRAALDAARKEQP